VKWFLSYWQCIICWTYCITLHSENFFQEGMECDECGFWMRDPAEDEEVPESFAKAEHERYGIPWEG